MLLLFVCYFDDTSMLNFWTPVRYHLRPTSCPEARFVVKYESVCSSEVSAIYRRGGLQIFSGVVHVSSRELKDRSAVCEREPHNQIFAYLDFSTDDRIPVCEYVVDSMHQHRGFSARIE